MKLITALCGILFFCAISGQSENLEVSPGEINKFEDVPENDEEVESNWFELQHETIEQQADQPTSGEQFIAIRIGATGSKDQVNPNLEELVRIATQFLPNSYTFINVVSASREVVAGIKYELLVNALDENRLEVQCGIRIIEQPWIITNKNEKLRTLIYSNCSTDDTNSNGPKTDDTQQSINPIFNNEEKVMTDERLKVMESLIITTDNKTPKPQQQILPQQPENNVSNNGENEDALTVVTLSKGTSSFLDDFFSFGKPEKKPVQGSLIENDVIAKLELPTRIEPTADRAETENILYHVGLNGNGDTPIASNTETSTQTATVQLNNVKDQLNGDVFQSTCAHIHSTENTPVADVVSETQKIATIDNMNENVERQKRASMDDNNLKLMERRLFPKLLKATLARLDRYDEDDNKRVFLKVIESQAYGNLYKFEVRIADTKCSENASSAENCLSHIIDDSIKLCRFEIEHLDNDDIKLKKSECVPDNRVKRQLGAARPVSESEQQQVVGFINVALENGDKPGFSLTRVIKATKQSVSGYLYKVEAEFSVDGSAKVCNIKIWDRPWLGTSAREVTFDCDAPARRKRQLVGGVNTIPNSEVETILSEVLSEGDYQSYRLIRIIKFFDTGSLYQIKAVFSIDQLTKICNVKIWYRLRLGKSDRLIEFDCDGSSREKPQITGVISPTSETDKPKIEGLLNEVLAEGDFRSYRLIRIIESTIQILSGTIYKIKAVFAIEKSSKICNVKIWDRPWLGKSAREVEFKCDELSRRKRQIRGGFKSIKVREKDIDNDFLKYIQDILNEILQSCDYQSYKLIRVIDSTSEVIAGFIYRIKAEFSVNGLAKICNIKIWEKESNQGREVQEFICQNRNKTRISGKSIIDKDLESTLEYAFDEAFTGKDINIETLDQEKIELAYLLNASLTSTAYKAYRLVRIIEFTKDNVAGILYRIKAEFAINGIEHICDVKFWHKNSGREKGVQELKCVQKSPILSGFNPTPEEDKPKVENLLREVLAYDDYQSYTLIKIVQSWQQIAVGINYKVRVEVKMKGELKICDIKILNMFTKHGKHAVQSVCQNIGEFTRGGSSPISNDGTAYIESIVNGALLQGNYQSYKLVKIIEATKQIVAGVLYRIKAQFVINGTDTICNLKIWDKVSNQRREVQEFICEESSLSVRGQIGATSEDENSVIKNILNEILDSGDYQSYRLVRIIASTKQIVEGVIYRITAEFAVNGTQKICSLKIWDKISNKGREIQEFICVEPSTTFAGDITDISEDEKPAIENILKTVLTTGDYQSYSLLRIIKSSKQIVAGNLYRIKAEFAVDGIQKLCNVKIWDKVSNQGSEVQEFICEDPTINHTSVMPGSHTNVVTATPLVHSRPGGISPVSEADKSLVENILKGVLSTGDYQSYRLVRIIESSKQIVSGILYRIKAEFAVDGTQKICNVKIWDKVSNQGTEVQEFICEEPAIDHTSILSESHTNGSTAATHEHFLPVLGGISAASEADKSVIENILKGVLSTGDYQSYRLVRIIESSKQIVSGILYRIKAEFAVDGIQKICNVKIWDKVSNQGREVQEFICEEPTINHTSILSGSLTNGSTATTQEHSIPVLGGISAASEADKSVIENILNGVLSTGDYQSYRLVRIIESSKQIVSGILYRIKAEFAVDGTQKICNVKIWDKVSNQGREVQEFICDGPAINHTSILSGSLTNGSTATTQEHSIPVLGGISATSEADKSVIENILKGVLLTGDYQSYRLVRVIESSKQIVSGILYRIKAEFAVDGTQKICNVKIWDKVSNQGREVQEFICEEPAIDHTSILSESHTIGSTAATQEHFLPVLGGISAASESDKSVFENILRGVLSTGDYQSYRLVRIIESSKQIVSGILYRIKTEFAVDGIQKICNVKIWHKVSNQGREVQEFICDGPTINHTSILSGSLTNGSTVTTQEHSIPVLGGISAASEADKSVIENILKGVLSTGDYQSYRLVRIIESSKQTVSGILYRIKAEFAVDGTQKICNVKIWDKVSNQGREVQEFICDGPTINHASILSGSLTNGSTAATQEHSIPVVGGISATSEADISVIENILKGVLSTGDYQSYRLVRIIESSKQIVSGILYRIKAEFAVDGTQKICNVKIWDKVSNQGREVQEFICEEPAIDHTSILSESHTNGSTAATQEHFLPVLGGISAASEADKSVIENILKGVLSTGDYQSYRLVRIIESSKQIVSGILYRIKAEFAVDGIQKICNVKIWDKVSNQGREVQEFICEELTINHTSILSGSLTNGSTATTQEHSIPVLGGISAASEADKSVIENILKGVLSTGDYQSYRLVRIIESSKQIVKGILYRIKAEFAVDGTQTICNVKIWDKVSNQGREVQEFICDGPTINHTSILSGSLTNGSTATTQEHSIPVLGGISAASEADKSVIENILKDVLSTGDYQLYRLVRIIESSKQIVSGILYRIKAEFAVDGTQKICNVKIWDKVSNQGREVQEFFCEEASINHTSVLSGTHTNGSTATTQEHSIPVLGGISAASEAEKSVIENILKGVLSTGDYQSYRLVRIIESSKQIVSGILYRIKAEFAVDGTEKICNVKIWDKVSNQGREVQEFICDGPTINHTSILSGSLTNGSTATTQEHSIPVLGGISATSEADKSVIENILKGVLSTGDYQSYRLVRIIESSKQIVSDILYRIKAEFAVDGTQKICNVKIWDKVSNQGREVQEFICDGPTINHTSILSGSLTNGSTATTQEHSIPVLGGISATSEADNSVIENILKGVLSTGDYQSYRLVRIIESSKQIVSGILYRIKAEFAVDGTQKICNVKIWDKVSNQGREVQEFICDEPTINHTSVLPGSHTNVVTGTTAVHFRPGGISAASEGDKTVIENILKVVLSTGDYQSYRLVRIIESSKQIVSGILYRIKAEFAVDGIQKICNVKIWDKVSNQGKEVQEFICDEPTINHTSVLRGSHTNVVTGTTAVHFRPGGISAASEGDKTVIENILKGVLSTGDYQSYRLVRIIESSKQIVSGILYRIKAEFAVDGTETICNVKIWDKVSNQGREVQEFFCEEASINHTSILSGSLTNGSTASTQQHSIPVLGGISATSEADKSVIENILKGVLSTGDYQSYRLVRIIESSKQIVAGILYRIKAEFAVDGTQKICNVKIWDKVSNQGREVQEFICDGPTINHTLILSGSLTNGSTGSTQEHSIPVLGGISATSEADKSVIENILKGVLSTGDYQSYRLVRIIESSKQIVSGILYRIKAEFAVDGTQKICNVKIWDKVSNQGREVQEFICDEPTMNHTSVLPGSHTNVVTSTTAVHFRPGGISAASEGDKTVIENILKGVLSTGDYQSYRLVRIIESSKQIVSGILYRIKAEFAVDDTEKICNVKIWDKVSNQGREVQEFICDGPTINHTSILSGSLTNGSTATTQEHSIPVLGGISATSEADKSVIENILKGVLSTGDYQSYRLVRIIESSKQIVSGILYRIKAEFAVDGTQKICNVKIWDKVSNQGREVQEFICDGPTINHTSILSGSLTNGSTATTQEHSIPVLGGISATSEADKSVIENILKGVLSTGDYQSYRLVRIIESSKQIVSGILYRIKAEFAVDGIQKICNVKIWDKVSNQGKEVQEFICDEPKINHTSVLPGSHTNVVTGTTAVNFRPGDISAASEGDKTVIENILKGVLSTGDYQSYRLVRIIESSKQTVSGILYRIKAEFAVDGTQTICNVKIWDKVSNQGREVQEFFCEEASINHTSVLSGTHTNGSTATTQEHSIPVLGGISAASEADKSVIRNILKGVLSTGDYQSYRLVRIIESSKQIVSGILYRIKAEFSIDGTQKICNVKIWDKVSNQGREVQEFICEEASINHTSVLSGTHTNISTATTQEHSIPVLGGISAASKADKSVIENILKGVLSTGDYKSYRLVRIIESSKQIVSGILYRINAEFAVDGIQKICNLKIWDKVTNQGREVQEFICDEPTINHASILTGSLTNGSTATTQEHSIPVLGGISATSEADKSVIENILKYVLSTGDYQSYRLVRIIESSKQIVSGILYRIKAEFAVDGTQKICNVKIWDKVSNQGREVQEFICEEPSILVLAGSDASGIRVNSLEFFKPLTGVSTTEADKSVIEKLLKVVLSASEYQFYRLVRIIESSKRLDGGVIYQIKAEFLINEVGYICYVTIWDKSPHQGKIQHEFNCRQTVSFLNGLHPINLQDKFILDQNISGEISSISVADKLKIESLLNEVLSNGDYQSYRLVRIIESTTQIVSGILYKIKAEFNVDGLSNICNVKIWDRPWLGKSGKQVEFKCDEIFRPKRQVPVEMSTIANRTKIESILNEVLVGDYSSFRLVRIIESSSQIVSGTLYKIKAEFSVDLSTKVCNIKIWDRPWLGNKSGRKVEFICESSRRKREIPGGSNSTSDSVKVKIEELLNKALAEGDYQSYRLLKIIKTSVTGTLFSIKAEFDLDGAEKFCDITIWKKTMNEDNKVTQFSCVRKRAIKRRSSSSSSSSSDSSESSERSNKSKIRNVLNDVLTHDDYQSYRLLRIIQGSRQKLTSGTLYYIEAIFIIDGDQRQCNVNINERIKSTRKVYFNCAQPTLVLPTTINGGFTIVPISEMSYIQNLVTEVLSEGEYQSYRVIRIIEASSQVVSGINYRVKAEFAVEDVQKTCVIIILVKLSNTENEVTEFTCDEPQEQQHTTYLWRKARQVQDRTDGSITKVTEFDKSYVESMLSDELLAGDYHSYRLVRIIKATRQVVSGSLYNIKAEFIIDGNTRNCSIQIWDQPWLGKAGRTVEFKGCDEDIPVIGGPRPLQENEYPKIEEMLNSALAEGDRQNYRFVKVIEATEQIVAGWLYRVKAEFSVDGNTEICKIKILQQPWMNKTPQVEFDCEKQ